MLERQPQRTTLAAGQRPAGTPLQTVKRELKDVTMNNAFTSPAARRPFILHPSSFILPLLLSLCLLVSGCRGRGGGGGPGYDRPFPLGQVTDAHWETQQANAEAADFIFYDHEFTGDTAELAPGAKKHLMEVALRLPHVPFPVVVEQSAHDAQPELDARRRQTIVEQLARLGLENVQGRVVVASAFAEGFTAIEGERAYYQTLFDNSLFNSNPSARGR